MAKHNLQAGRIRMVFVADVIPPELQRIVEFLNGQMDPAEVLALEVRQFVGQGQQALVPKLIGQTAAAQQAKATPTATPGRQWDEATFLEDLGGRGEPGLVGVAVNVLRWAHEAGLRIAWGSGKGRGSVYLMVDHPAGVDWTVSIWTTGGVEVHFQQLVGRSRQVSGHPFETEAQRMVLLGKLNQLPGVALDPARVALRPNFDLAVLVDPAVSRQFFEILDWVVAELRAQQPS